VIPPGREHTKKGALGKHGFPQKRTLRPQAEEQSGDAESRVQQSRGWCRRTAVGRAVKWWFPARWFGIHHQNRVFDGMSKEEIREWKRRQALR
jgi:hypothetical protein